MFIKMTRFILSKDYRPQSFLYDFAGFQGQARKRHMMERFMKQG